MRQSSNQTITRDNLNQPHGVFTPDQKHFIFSSAGKDMQLDLYIVEVTEDGGWSVPELLSSKLTTSSREDSPYITRDGKTLYFSSDRPGGYGNYDVYKSDLIEGEWSIPQNMGMPINSSGHDIFFTYNDNQQTGFLSSNRGGTYGAMDIYMFTNKPYPTFDCDEIVDKINNVGSVPKLITLGEPIANELMRFDASGSTFNDAELSNIFWKVDDEVLKLDHEKLDYIFKKAGNHSVASQIYGYDKKANKYLMECVSVKFEVLSQKLLYLVINSDKNILENTSLELKSDVLNLLPGYTVEYDWYIDSEFVKANDSIINYVFKDTGLHEVRVRSIIRDANGDNIDTIQGYREINVYDMSDPIASVDEDFEPSMSLNDNKDPNTGRINALQAEMFNIPDDRNVFYDWYINNSIVKSRSSNLFSYNFQPLDVIKVVGNVMYHKEEPEFILEATKVIPPDELVKVGDIVTHESNGNTGHNPDVEKADNLPSDISKMDPVYFPFDKYYLTTAAKKIIDQNILTLKGNNDLAIILEGNTDSKGNMAYNLRLSEKRAKTVYEYLKRNGIADSQIKGINANGEAKPVEDNKKADGSDNPNGRKINRRVDFTITQK